MSNTNNSITIGITVGLCIGNVLAALISWSNVELVGWTWFHSIFGWLYVIISLFNGNARF